MPEPIDWSRYQQCGVCSAGLGKSCVKLSGYNANSGSGASIVVEADEPHSTRKLRAEAARTGGSDA